MIIGNPNRFAMFIEKVNLWNYTNTNDNGLIFFFVGGKVFPIDACDCILNMTVLSLEKFLKEIPEDREIFDASSENAVKMIINKTYPSNENMENNYDHVLQMYELLDNNYYLLGIKKSDKVRIISAKIDYDNDTDLFDFENIKTEETVISQYYVDKFIEQLEKIKRSNEEKFKIVLKREEMQYDIR